MKKLMSCVVVLITLIGCKPSEKQHRNTSHQIAGYEYPAKQTQVMQTYEYQGIIPENEGSGTLYDLTISRSEYASDGKYILITTNQPINNRRQQSNTSRGNMEIQRGNAGDPNAMIYKLTDEVDDTILYLQVVGNNKLRLLTTQIQDTVKQAELNYYLELIQ